MTAAGGSFPERFDQRLDPSAPAVVSNVLEEAELTAGTEDALDFLEGGLGTRNRTEDQRGDDDVEGLVLVGKCLGPGVSQVDRETQVGGRRRGLPSHVRVGFDGVERHVSVGYLGEVRKEGARSRANVEHPALEALDQVLAVGTKQGSFGECGRRVVNRCEQRVGGIVRRHGARYVPKNYSC